MHQFTYGKRLFVKHHLVGLQFGELEQVGDQILQIFTVLVDHPQVFLLLLLTYCLLFKDQCLGITLDR